MADIRKNLTLSAQLDDSQLRKQLEVLKKEMGNAFSVDGGSLNDLKSAVRDVAKEFGAQLRKELDGVRGQKGKVTQAQQKSVDVSEIGSIQVREMQVTNMVVNSMILKGAAQGATGTGVPGAPTAGGGVPPEERPSDFMKKNRNLLTLGAAGLAVQQGVMSLINIQQQVAERQNRLSRDLDAGLGVEGIAREAGRGRLGMALAAGAAGAGVGGLTGAKVGAAAGGLLGPAGAGVGGAIGGILGAGIGGVTSFFGASNAMGELSKEQVQLLADAESRARAISPLRQQMLAGGGINRDTLNDQMRVGARQFGMGPEETLQAMLQAREVLGNEGAASSFNQILGNQRFLGVGAGTTAQAIETFAGAGGESRAQAANKQAEVIKKGVAAGLDVSKSGKFLQTTMQYLQNTVGLGRADTGAATTRIAAMAAGLGGGQVTDITLQQAQTLAQMRQQESSSIQGLAGAANLTQLQEISGRFGGFGTGTTMALAGLSANAGEQDILSVLSEGQRTGEVGKDVDLASAVKEIQAAKQRDATLEFAQRMASGNRNVAFMALGGEQNFQGAFTTESMLGRERAARGAITPEQMATAGGRIDAAREGVQQAPEFRLDVAQFTRNAESAGKGLETFTEVTVQMTNQMRKMLADLEGAQKRFSEMSRQTGFGPGIQR